MKGGTVKFKNNKIETPEMHPGAKLQKRPINGISCWAISSEGCVKAAVNTTGTSTSQDERWSMPKRAGTPMNIAFVAEFDNSKELEPNNITSSQEMIGMHRWATELGRVDIPRKISILLQHQASPRVNHVKQLLPIFGCLRGSANCHSAWVVPTFQPSMNCNSHMTPQSSSNITGMQRRSC